MKPQDWDKLDQVLDAVLDLPEERWVEFVRQAGLSPQLLEALERQLAGDGALGTGIDSVAGALADRVANDLSGGEGDGAPTLELGQEELASIGHAPGDVVGKYRLGRELGRGGMGRVFVADRIDGGFKQQVAIKLIRGDASHWGVEQRFKQERQILAALEHPHVARLLDGGLSDRGVPYFVMELVDGRSIYRYCAKLRLSIEDRIRLFQQVCDAVAHAHRNLVVHRDLKPGNILISRSGQAKLLDFGIAKILSPTGDQEDTQVLGRVLTPRYAAPEQLLGESITTATDVFGLGLVLAELLVGPALVAGRGQTVADAVRWHQAEMPSLTGALASYEKRDEVAASSRQSVASLRRFLRGDLEAIVRRALAAAPEERYGTAAALRDDLERYLQGEPVEAARGHLAYRARLFLKRNRTPLLAVAAVLLTLAGGWWSTARQASRAASERDRAQGAEERALALNRYLVDDVLGLARPEESGGKDLTLRELLEVASRRAETSLAENPALDGAIRGAIGETYLSLGDLKEAEQNLRRSLDLLLESGETDTPEIWQARRLLARLQRDQGSASRAASDLDDLVSDLAEADASTGEVLLTRILLAEVLSDSGDRTRAERELREVLGQLEFQAANTAEVSSSALRRQAMFALATTLQAQRQSSAAARIGENLLALQQRDLGPRHPEVVDTLQLLADAAARMQKNTEAQARQRQVVDLRTEVLGGDHPKTIRSVLGLGRMARRVGDLEGGLAIYLDAAARSRRALGANSITVAALNAVGVVSADVGDLQASIEHYEEALNLSVEVSGEESPGSVRIMKNLVRSYRDFGQTGQAISMSRRVIDVGLRGLESEEPDWTTLQDLADFVGDKAPVQVRDLELAERLAGEAVEISERRAPEALAELGDVYWKTGRLEQGIEIMGEALRLPDSLYLYSIERSMNFMLEERDGLKVAEGFLRSHLARRLEARGERSVLVGNSRWLLGRNLMLQSRLPEAIEQFDGALAALADVYRADDDRVVRVRAYRAAARASLQSSPEQVETLVVSCEALLEARLSLEWVQTEACAFAREAAAALDGPEQIAFLARLSATESL